MTAIVLSELLGVSRQAVSSYEKGAKTPSPATMGRITEALKFPDAFFFRALPPPQEKSVIFYRSISAATKTARTREERRFGWVKEITEYLHRFLQFPATNFPTCEVSDDPNRLSEERIEEIARKAREHWKLGDGPIGSVVGLLENNGAVVVRYDLDSDTLDSFSEYSFEDQTPYMVLGSHKGSAVRSRFDASHETGHILLHRGIDKSRIGRPADHKVIEQQAHRFAAAFLLPAESFSKDLYACNLDAMRALKPKWKVSIAMMIKRSEHLGFIRGDQVQRMWMNYARRGWKRVEPLDDVMAAEQPRLLKRSFEILMNENVQTRGTLLANLPFMAKDIETLIGLPQGFLSELAPDIRILDFGSRKPGGEKNPLREPAKVIPFKKEE
jgi:Zn-dependent peptidase ImmA (M78 family)/DNA-binding XRE family transcriptional regulator